MRWEKAEVLLRLARRLAGSSEGLTLDEMAREAEVERRTAERMRDALDRLFDLEDITEGRSKRFRIRGGLDAHLQTPSADELAELDIAARHLAATGQADRAALLRSLSDKIQAALRSSARRRIEPDLEALLSAEALAMQAGPRPQVEPETLALVRVALKGSLSLRFHYGTSARSRHVDPWGILFGRQPYLVGPARSFEKPVLWRLDRMRRLALGEPALKPPTGFSLAVYAAQSFGAFHESPEDVALRFGPEAAQDARRFLFHPDQTLEATEDGGLLVRFRAGGMLELAHHLFTWGDAVEIIGPDSLRALMVEQLRRALGRHVGKGGAEPGSGKRACGTA